MGRSRREDHHEIEQRRRKITFMWQMPSAYMRPRHARTAQALLIAFSSEVGTGSALTRSELKP
jgi:hypothetical protein